MPRNINGADKKASLWRTMPFLRPYSWTVANGLFTNILARIFELLPFAIIGEIVDRLNTGQNTQGSWFAYQALLIFGTFVGLALFQSLSDYCWTLISQKVRHDLRVKIYDHLQRLEASFFEERHTGDLMSVIVSDIDNLEGFFADAITAIIRIIITFAGTYAILFFRDWRLALLLFAPLPFVLVAIRYFAISIQPKYKKARLSVGVINSIVENNLSGMGVIQAYTAEEFQSRRVRGSSEEYRDASIKAGIDRAKFIPVIYAIAGLAYAGLIGFGALLTFGQNGPSLGDFASFVLFSMRLVMPLFLLGIIINQLQRCEASAERVLELLDTRPSIKNTEGAMELAAAPESIEFRGVGFSYPKREETLHGLSFKVGRGQMAGVVGPTGAGKSTIIKLLLRYYEPSRGEILIDGIPIEKISLESLRKHIGYVSQDAFLFSGTIAENILLGAPGASVGQMRRAAKLAGAEEFILDLPESYDTWVGERGVKLSGGQRQRISLARALVRDPAILLLDEATSAVDTRTEEIIQRGLSEFGEGRMTIAVAHRLSTVKGANEILVLVDGAIVQHGTHETLSAEEGVYRNLWSVQSGMDAGDS